MPVAFPITYILSSQSNLKVSPIHQLLPGELGHHAAAGALGS